MGPEVGAAGGPVEADRRRRDANGPEEARATYARLKIMPLMGRVADGARIVQVNSYEAERTVAQASVGTHVQTMHEPHVRVEVPRRAVTAMGPAADLRPGHNALEVSDR